MTDEEPLDAHDQALIDAAWEKHKNARPVIGKVTYTGATNAQVNWGSCDDPRPRLVAGNQYEVEDRRVHSWHTKLKLVGVPGWFNSVCFDES